MVNDYTTRVDSIDNNIIYMTFNAEISATSADGITRKKIVDKYAADHPANTIYTEDINQEAIGPRKRPQ